MLPITSLCPSPFFERILSKLKNVGELPVFCMACWVFLTSTVMSDNRLIAEEFFSQSRVKRHVCSWLSIDGSFPEQIYSSDWHLFNLTLVYFFLFTCHAHIIALNDDPSSFSAASTINVHLDLQRWRFPQQSLDIEKQHCQPWSCPTARIVTSLNAGQVEGDREYGHENNEAVDFNHRWAVETGMLLSCGSEKELLGIRRAHTCEYSY